MPVKYLGKLFDAQRLKFMYNPGTRFLVSEFYHRFCPKDTKTMYVQTLKWLYLKSINTLCLMFFRILSEGDYEYVCGTP